MAEVKDLNLDITVHSNDDDPTVTVTYTVTFDTDDVKNDVQYIEEVTLWGDDGGLKGADDPISAFDFNDILSPGGKTSLNRTKSKRVSKKDLDEDKLDADELYAQVILTPSGGSKGTPVRSDNVKERF
jgi:hypothetical protein